MATRLATQRNYITVTPITSSQQSNSNDPKSNNSIMNTSSITTTNELVTAGAATIQVEPNGTATTTSTTATTAEVLQQVLRQKKLILQATTPGGGVSVIDIVPIDSVDASDSSPVHVNISTDPLTGDDDTQQVTAVVQAQSPADSGPHYITVTVSSQDNVPSHGTYHVQYVDSEIYTATGQGQSQMTYPVYAVGDYTTGGQQYYTTSNGNFSSSTSSTGNPGTSYIVPVEDSILSTQSSDDSPQTATTSEVTNYIHQTSQSTAGGTNSSNETDNVPSLTHAQRVSPATVSWLLENYETAEGVSLPRSTLYNHYMRHCNEHKLDAVNAASFGKLIRSVFMGLRTRRLGTRGNSKYHYYGIRIKPGSNLVSSIEEKPQVFSHSSGQAATSGGGGRTYKKSGAKPETYEACSQYLGDGSAAIPIFPSIELTHPYPEDIILEDVDTLRSIYREHCEAFLDAVLNLEFNTIESLWREFWRSQDNNNGDECEEEKYLSKSKLYSLCLCEDVQNFIKQVDLSFYQNMVDVLIPDVLQPIPSSLTQAIRNFAKNLENWLTSAMSGCPDKIVQIKLQTVSAFSQTLRRYTSLNHLAQAARAVLQNSSQIAQMLNDLNRVDFHNVQEQASWVCQCEPLIVQRFENDFKAALQQQNTLEQWAAWLRMVVDTALEDYRGKPSFPKAARQFLLKWSFYSSMVIRDLTLRSAASFGSFHLIRLLYDEYMFFIVEHKVAEATNTTPIAVMGQIELQNDAPDFFYTSGFDVKLEPCSKKMRS